MNDEKHRHHAGYVSEQDVIHKCLNTYLNLFSNMPFSWYVDRIHESVGRKVGVKVSRELVQQTVAHFLKGKIDFCPQCYR